MNQRNYPPNSGKQASGRPSRTVGSTPPPVTPWSSTASSSTPSWQQPPAQPPVPPPPGGRGDRRASGAFDGILLGAALFFIALFVALGVAALGYLSVARTLPPADQLITLASLGQSTRIYARDGSLLQAPLAPNDPTAGLRRSVPIDQISPYLIKAVVATEDSNFYQHRGVDPIALARAIFRAVQNRGPVVGTSTISQQLAKLVFLSPERKISRKVKEAILAAEISRRYSKDTILELYLNEIYYGNLAYGVETASQVYFNKPAKDVTLAEAALLTGLPQWPATYDPLQNPEAAKARQADVLRLMVENGSITATEADAAWNEPLTYYGSGLQGTRLDKAPHFVMTVRSQIEQLYGPEVLYRGGLQIYTTLDPRLQSEAEAQVKTGVAELQGRNVSNGALVALDPRTSEILAMVGSADFNNAEISGQVNIALSPRQPGSTIKPFTYLATFERAAEWWTPATVIDDVRTEFDDGPNRPPYVPVNYDGRDHGRISVRTALANSYNIPAVKALQHVGVDTLLQVAERFGMATLTRPDHPPYGLALTLGGGEVTLLEMTNAYAALANGGVYTPPAMILCVLDANGAALERLDTGDLPAACRDAPAAATIPTQRSRQSRAATPQHSFLITHILQDNEARTPAFGPNSVLQIGRPAAVKTGTTNDVKDIWTVGYTPQLVTGVWVGNADGAAMDTRLSGIAGAGPIWNRFMRAALADVPAQDFARPAGVEQVEICTLTGARPDTSCPADRRRLEWFSSDQLPAGADISAYRVDIVSPINGQTLEGLTPIIGHATIPNFAYYLVEYGESFTPGAWGVVAGPVNQPVENGELAQWDVSQLASEGPHVVRVVAVDQSGARFESTPVQVEVRRAAPTDTPSPTSTDTETPEPSPLPDETGTPDFQPTETPVFEPTATVIPPTGALTARLDAPQEGDTLAGFFAVQGEAGGPTFASYSLEVLVDGVWQPMSLETALVFTPAQGALGIWDTTLLSNGFYVLRLTVNGVNGESVSTETSISIAN